MSGIYETIWGNVGRDATTRNTANGNAVAGFSVCANVQSGKGEQEPVWREIVVFGRQAEFCARIKKGDQVTVIGRMTIDRWTNESGEVKERVQIIASEVIQTRQAQPQAQPEPQTKPQQQDKKQDPPF